MKCLFTIGLFLCLTSYVIAQTYYVSPAGQDGASGSLEDPWSIQHAFKNVPAGATVYLRGGKYNLSNRVELIGKKGSSSLWTTFEAYQNEVPEIDGLSWKQAHPYNYFTDGGDIGLVYIIDCEYVRIKGLKIINSPSVGLRVQSSKYVEIIGNHIENTYRSGIEIKGYQMPPTAQYIYVRKNRVESPNQIDFFDPDYRPRKCPNEGITFGRVWNFEITDNIVSNGDKEGIDCKGPCAHGLIKGNEVYGHRYSWYTVGIYIDGWTDLMEDIEVTENYVHDCGEPNIGSYGSGDGIVVNAEGASPVKNVRVHHNLVKNTIYTGISVDSDAKKEGQETYVEDIQIYNNTVSGVRNGILLAGSRTVNGNEYVRIRNIDIRNNLIDNCEFQIIKDQPILDYAKHNVVVAYNMSDKDKTNNSEDFGSNHSVFPDLGLNSDFTLKASSPAIDSGDPDPKYNDPDGSRNDIGFKPYGAGSGCTISLSKSFHDFGKAAGNTTVTVTTSESFTISDDQDWITISKSGNTVTITVTENTGSDSRTGTVTVTGCSSSTLTVTQQGQPPVANPQQGSCASGEASFIQSSGEVVVEAENFNSNDQNNDVVQWQSGSSQAGFSGTGYVYVEEEATNYDNGAASDNARLTYNIEFTEAGTYTIWVRRWVPDGAGNSVYAALGGIQSTENDNTGDNTMWVWKSLGTVTTSGPGIYTLELIRREDGYMADKIVINSGEQPSGEGPEETTCISTGINSTGNENRLKIYPNPLSGQVLNIELSSGQPAAVEIFDMTGKMAFQRLAIEQNLQLNPENFKKGLYLLKIRTHTYATQRKLIIQ